MTIDTSSKSSCSFQCWKVDTQSTNCNEPPFYKPIKQNVALHALVLESYKVLKMTLTNLSNLCCWWPANLRCSLGMSRASLAFIIHVRWVMVWGEKGFCRTYAPCPKTISWYFMAIGCLILRVVTCISWDVPLPRIQISTGMITTREKRSHKEVPMCTTHVHTNIM